MYDQAYLEEKEIIMIRDLNLDFLKPHNVPQKWYNILDKYHINQLINEPTIVKKKSKTCIHHIYVTNPEHTRSTKGPHISLSCMLHEKA